MKLLILILLLSGCAMSPSQIKEKPPHSRFEMQSPAQKAATCMLNQLDELYPDMISTARKLDDGSHEISTRLKEQIIIVTNIKDIDHASTGSIYFRWDVLTKETFATQIIKASTAC
jgi:uncharacterized lipoprotein YajG